uniref:Cytochrome c oxidase subunit 2 n=1 Tax=Parevania sp. SJW-2015 TaxID=1725431 RepID=A0A384RIG2_9HYME|nr:cytochrome c oxidase subunit II [Parevania sp. SJW-2015]
MPSWLLLNFQDAFSPVMEQLIFFHDYSMVFMIMIMTIIAYMMFFIIFNKFSNKFIFDNQFIEILWTSTPMMILIFMAIPSLKILYILEEMSTPLFNIKINGHQWYWSYEIKEFNLNFDSFINKKINLNSFRLLEVDNNLIIPWKMNINLIVSSFDVIHSWTVPSLGIKMDAIPGRLNQTPLFSKHLGIFYGQCSEICGINHSFMPIAVESTSFKMFMYWMMFHTNWLTN